MFGFSPPPVIRSEVFATMPDAYRKTRMGATRTRSESGTVLEGPSFDRDGNLYVTDIPNGRIFRIPARGRSRRSSKARIKSASRGSTISFSRETAICTSPTKAWPRRPARRIGRRRAEPQRNRAQ